MSLNVGATVILTPTTKLPSFDQLVTNPRLFLALGFGSGLAPKAPGTFGTLMAVPVFMLLQLLPWSGYLAVVVASAGIGIYLCDYAGKYLGVSDHGAIVWDEFVGFWITMLFAPNSWLWLVYGFLLFRVFDILKPWPIGWADQKVKGGFGVMLDDILAGLMALAVLQATVFLLS